MLVYNFQSTDNSSKDAEGRGSGGGDAEEETRLYQQIEHLKNEKFVDLTYFVWRIVSWIE